MRSGAATPLRKRLARLEGPAWSAHLAALSDERLCALMRRFASASPDFARQLRATGGGWVLDGKEAPESDEGEPDTPADR